MKRILTLYFFASRTNSNVRVVPLAFAHRDEQIAYVNQKCSKGSKNSIFGSTCSNRILTLYIFASSTNSNARVCAVQSTT